MISVIIPAYKETVLSETVGKLFTEMGFDVQVLISDDETPHQQSVQ